MTKKCDMLEYGDFQFAREDERIVIRDLSTGEDVLLELTEARALHSWLGYALDRTAPEPLPAQPATEGWIRFFDEIERRYSPMSCEDAAKFVELRERFCREPNAARDGTAVKSGAPPAMASLYKCGLCGTPMRCGHKQWEYTCNCNAQRTGRKS